MNNITTLTRSHNIIAAKKRAKRDQIQEILFDDNARTDFLTGFHKRKLAKADAARKKAQEREKQQRLEIRREQRRALREQAIENAKRVEGAYASIYGQGDGHEDDEWSGINSSPNDKGKQRDEEYEDEQVLATVTVVEDFDPDAILHGPIESLPSKTTTTKSTPASEPVSPPKKPQKIRYQPNAARKAERLKQLSRRSEKAERAGGKSTRKSSLKKKQKKGGSR